MAIPATPSNFVVQQGDAQAFVSWNLTAGATSYHVQRSTDQGLSYSSVGTPTTPYYLDTSVTVGTQYYYKVASVNSDGTSSYTVPQSVVPSNLGLFSLGQVRLMSKQRADMVNSNYVTVPEWNTYINQSYTELYDLLITVYEDYYVTGPTTLTADGTNTLALPTDFYKLMGVDGAPGSVNSYVTLKKFDFIARNQYIYPQLTSSLLGAFNPQYRLVGNVIQLIPTPPNGQIFRIWYIPRPSYLLQDTDMLDGIAGWSEYVIVDAAIKAMQKEESDVSVLMNQKMMLKQRIEESAMNRDAGQPDTISNVRRASSRWGGDGFGFNGGFAGL